MRPSDYARRSAGRYVLGELLGRGGMAEVFAGHSLGDHGFQKPVAIKRLLPELASDQVFVARLIDEAKLLVGMQHGNIVSVLDLARDGDDVFLVMEFVDGPSLRQLLKARGPRGLSIGTATYIVQAAAAGLEFAHARPGGAIIHADISPSNLLLTTSGEVRVADFGIARREGGGYGVVEGKWAYMAPEQARGEPLTPRSDVFALGVVLYELICGAHPFGRQVTHEERDSQPMRVIPPRVVKPSIPHGIDAIVMRALAHDPRDRYARMQQLIDAIVEERFTNQWREGASDLAQAIREAGGGSGVPQQPRTMVTDRPVTIMTRSLLRELTPPPAHTPPRSAPRIEGTPQPQLAAQAYAHAQSARASSPALGHGHGHAPAVPALPDSGAHTNNVLVEDIARAAALLEIPPVFRSDGGAMPQFRFATPVDQGHHDLASVVGGHTMTGSQHVADQALEARGVLRWTLAVLGIAALIGTIAATAIHFARGGDETGDDVGTVFGSAVDKMNAQRQALASIQVAAAPPPVQAAPTIPAAPPPSEPPPSAGEPLPSPGEPSAPPAGEPSAPSLSGETSAAPAGAPDEPVAAPAPPDRPGGRRTNRQSSSPAPARQPGFVRVSTDPWGWASVGKQRVDTINGKLTLPPGRHVVRIECAACDSRRSTSRAVTVRSTMTEQIRIIWDDEED